MDRMETLTQSASEKFKQSEVAEWDECIYQEGKDLLAEVERLLEETARIGEEIERRFDHAALEEQMRMPPVRPSDHDQRWYRKDLTTGAVPETGDMDQMLPEALEQLLSQVPRSWRQHQQSSEQLNAVLQPLLLYGRERWGTGFMTLHKYAYYLSVACDHLNKEPLLDIYTAARAVPQICSLGLSLETLKDVKGARRKILELWQAPSSETDSRIFELLVAAAFARMGHDVAFIEETAEKTPDLRLHGKPIPIVIECKRRQALNDYEVKEFSVIRKVFAILCDEQEKLGLVGELAIDFEQEMINLPVSGIVESIRDITKSLSPYGAKETEWGAVHLKPVAVSQEFEHTCLYSPEFLERVFQINLELDEFDGICAVARNNRFPEVDRAELPFLMKWRSNSKAATEKKLQTIKYLWIQAVDQIPTGEAGLIYLAYEEGYRPLLADARTDAIRRLADTIYFKRRGIVIPMTLISRLFPNVILEGRPDLIESTIPLVQGDKDNYDFWTEEMPTRVFTRLRQ